MSGETGEAVSGLTVDTLKLLVDERDRRYEERASWQERLRIAEKEATEKALRLADSENKHRLDELNNLRQEYTHDRGGFITGPTFDAFKEQMGERFSLLVAGMADLKATIEHGQGRGAGLAQGLGWVAAAVAVVLAVVGFVVK